MNTFQAMLAVAKARAAAVHADEKGEANVFVIIISILAAAVFLAIIITPILFGAQTVSNTGETCIEDPTACEIVTG